TAGRRAGVARLGTLSRLRAVPAAVRQGGVDVRGLGLPVFRQFFRDVHGVWPFPWQERLLHRVLNDPQPRKTTWPEAITLPTASGKTACLDVALFALAAQADMPPQKRTAPRRI